MKNLRASDGAVTASRRERSFRRGVTRGSALWRGGVALGSLALTSVVLSACGSSSAAPATTAASAAKTVACTAPTVTNIGEFTGAGVTLTSDVATAKGYFQTVNQQCHTTVQIQTFSSPQAMLSGLATGQLQFVIFTLSNDVLASLRGQQLEEVLNLGQGGGGVLVTSPSNASRGSGIKALKQYGAGTTWAITSLASTANAYCNALLSAAGVDVSKINYVPVGIAGAASAVTSGKAAVGYANAVQAGSLVQSKQAYAIMNTGGSEAYAVTGFQPALGLQALPSFVSQYSQLAQAVAEAELKGLFFLQSNIKNPSAVYNLEPATYRSTTPEATFAAGWGWNVGFFAPATGLLTQNDVSNVVKLMKTNSLIPSSAQPTVTLDPALVKAAYEHLGRSAPTSDVDLSILKEIPNG